MCGMTSKPSTFKNARAQGKAIERLVEISLFQGNPTKTKGRSVSRASLVTKTGTESASIRV